MKLPRYGRIAAVGVLLSLFVLTGSFLASAAEQQTDRVLKAGAVAIDITPPLGQLIVGGWTPSPATNIHDPLHARCLVLDDGQTRIGFAICDNVGIPREVFDKARKLMAESTDLPPENVLMAATHTHSATTARDGGPYPELLAERIAEGMRQALANMEPAEIGWGGVEEPSELFNRRWYVSDPELRRNPFGGVDQVRMNPPSGHASLIKPAGPVDPEISFISVRATNGRPIALLANYSLHYVGGVESGDVSADYFGIFATRIGELLGAEKASPPFVGIMTNGTSGDVNNINFRERGERREPYEKMTEVAELVAQRVAQAHKKIEFHKWVKLGIASHELALNVRKPDDKMREYFAQLKARPEDAAEYHSRERIYADRVQTLWEGPDQYTVLLQAVRIGDLGIAAIPFEVFTEIGLEIKQKSPFEDTFNISLANGSYGYLPTPAQHALGGYETWMGTNKVQLDASERITEAVLSLLEELHGRRS